MNLNRSRFFIAGLAASCVAIALFILGVAASPYSESMVCSLQDACEGVNASLIYQVGAISYFILNIIPAAIIAWLFAWLPNQPIFFLAAASSAMLLASAGWWWGLGFLFQRFGLLASEHRLRMSLYAFAAVLVAGNLGLIWYFSGSEI